MDVKFKRGTEANLPAIEDGSLIFTTDKKRLYLDNGTERLFISGDALVITLNYVSSKYQLNYTFAEIYEAHNAGKALFVYRPGGGIVPNMANYIMTLQFINSSKAVFTANTAYTSSGTLSNITQNDGLLNVVIPTLTVDSTDKVTFTEYAPIQTYSSDLIQAAIPSIKTYSIQLNSSMWQPGSISTVEAPYYLASLVSSTFTGNYTIPPEIEFSDVTNLGLSVADSQEYEKIYNVYEDGGLLYFLAYERPQNSIDVRVKVFE